MSERLECPVLASLGVAASFEAFHGCCRSSECLDDRTRSMADPGLDRALTLAVCRRGKSESVCTGCWWTDCTWMLNKSERRSMRAIGRAEHAVHAERSSSSYRAAVHTPFARGNRVSGRPLISRRCGALIPVREYGDGDLQVRRLRNCRPCGRIHPRERRPPSSSPSYHTPRCWHWRDTGHRASSDFALKSTHAPWRPSRIEEGIFGPLRCVWLSRRPSSVGAPGCGPGLH
ncbi:hypothetical protein C8Q77DRAFT_485852 [Trametes polyzona]|nr:hypothetical protein C8Q77DRAFT_485852 [Trametes polyzona]